MYLPVTPENMEKMALDVIDLLIQYNMMEDTCIYARGLCFSEDCGQEGTTYQTPGGHTVRAVPCPAEEIPGDFKSPETLTAAFEGNRLFDAMNISDPDNIRDKLNDIFHPYDLYLEQGYQWNFYAQVWTDSDF